MTTFDQRRQTFLYSRRIRILLVVIIGGALTLSMGGCASMPEAKGGTDPFVSGRRLLEENHWRKTLSEARRLVVSEDGRDEARRRALHQLRTLRNRTHDESYPSVSMGLRHRVQALIDRLEGPSHQARTDRGDWVRTDVRFQPFAFHWPVEGARITSGFGQRRDPFHPGEVSFHNGIDLVAGKSDAVLAAGPGRIVFAGWREDGCGVAITLAHPGGFISDYCHLESISVKLGAYVPARSVIGRIGQTGRSTGPHLHWGLWYNGAAVDPHAYVGRYVRSRLPGRNAAQSR